jgi:predicted acylesterase/phospholipase RssA
MIQAKLLQAVGFLLLLCFPTSSWAGERVSVLCIDGGGTRGIAPLAVLQLIEASTNKPITELFTHFCGTSTGSIIVAAIALLGLSVSEVEKLYQTMGEEVFGDDIVSQAVGMLRDTAKFDASKLESVFKKIIGQKLGSEDIRLSDNRLPKRPVMMVSSLADISLPVPFLFRNYPAAMSLYSGSSTAPLWAGLRGTTAAETFFVPQEVETTGALRVSDGGILANNPSQLMLEELERVFDIKPSDIDYFVSIGTGKVVWSHVAPGLLATVNRLANIATQTELTHDQTRKSFGQHRSSYFRFNYPIGAIALDETNQQKLQLLYTVTDSSLRADEHFFDLIRLMKSDVTQSAVPRRKPARATRPLPTEEVLYAFPEDLSGGYWETTTRFNILTEGTSKCGTHGGKTYAVFLTRGSTPFATLTTRPLDFTGASAFEMWVARYSYFRLDLDYSLNGGRTWTKLPPVPPVPAANPLSWEYRRIPLPDAMRTTGVNLRLKGEDVYLSEMQVLGTMMKGHEDL